MTVLHERKTPPKGPTVSPLRYPGGKSSLYAHLRAVIVANNLTSGTYVEPYAGGAGAALGLLITGQVQRIIINDLDPAIFAFWNAIVFQPSDFLRKLASVDVSVAEWQNQKQAYASAPRTDYLRLGFATFYLNRTNHSGVLNGGPIGGKDQSGSYKIDARFNREELHRRISLIASQASCIDVTNCDGIEVIQKYARSPSTFIYADPPYFEKAGSLYMNAFKGDNHKELAACLNEVTDARWLLTYDCVPQVTGLYSERRKMLISLNYSAHRVIRARELMIFSDGLIVPELDGTLA